MDFIDLAMKSIQIMRYIFFLLLEVNMWVLIRSATVVLGTHYKRLVEALLMSNHNTFVSLLRRF